jgi:hypothetical protein
MKLGIMVAVHVAAITLATASLAQTVGLGTSPPGGFAHTQGTVIAAEVSDASDVQMRIQPFSSPGVYLPAINNGELEFGLASMFEAYLATEGQMHFEGKALPDIRLVSTMSTLRLGFFVRADSDIRTLADLKGKRVTSGFTQQPVIQPLAAALFEAGGLAEGDYTGVPVPTVVRGADDFVAGRTDAFFFALGSGKVTEADAAVGGVRLLPVPDTPEARAAVKKHVLPGYVRAEQPAPGMVGVNEPTPALAYDSAMLVGAGVPEDTVYKVTKALHERADKMRAATPALAFFEQAAMAKQTDPVKYHPGAIRFYTEAGMWPPKE